jgi:CheY-like chemotaxis protein
MRSRARILVADDDPELLDVVVAALEQWGADVARADSGAQLIERLAHEGPFDLIVTDISMPWMSGMQAMYSARTAGLATPVVVMTALKEDRIPAQVTGLGQNAVLLRKPFELSELERVVSRLLAVQPPEPRSAEPPR